MITAKSARENLSDTVLLDALLTTKVVNLVYL